MLPIILYLMDLVLIRGLDRERMLRDAKLAALPIAIVAAITLVLISPEALLQGYANRSFTMMERLLTEPRVLLFYLSQMLLPIPARFTLIHDIQLSTSLWQPWTTLPAILFWIGWAWLGVFLAHKRPFVAFAMLFFLINHVVESSFLPLELIYEHRNYLPTMMLYPLAALGILWLARRLTAKPPARAAVALATVAFVSLQGYTVMERNALFAHPILLWEDNLAKVPEQSRLHTNIGQLYAMMGMPRKARESYEAALSANRFQRRELRAVPLGNLGNNHLRVGELEQAKAYYAQAIEINPNAINNHVGLSVALMGLAEFDTAKPVVETALQRRPDDPILLSLYAPLLFKLGDYPAAIAAAEKVVANNPMHDIARRVLGESHLRLGHLAEAQGYWNSVAVTNPSDVEATLALLKLADLTADESALRRAARRLRAIKKGQTWDELFGHLEQNAVRSRLTFLDEPQTLLPLVARALPDWEE